LIHVLIQPKKASMWKNIVEGITLNPADRPGHRVRGSLRDGFDVMIDIAISPAEEGGGFAVSLGVESIRRCNPGASEFCG
jgi:hypothetical protein